MHSEHLPAFAYDITNACALLSSDSEGCQSQDGQAIKYAFHLTSLKSHNEDACCF